MNFIGGFLIICVGIFIVIKSEAFLSNFGRIAFFERYLGLEGGSRLGYKIIGFIIIFLGTLIMTNLINDFMSWSLSPLTKYSSPALRGDTTNQQNP